jgi:hypothetical protein
MKVPKNWWVGCSGYNLHEEGDGNGRTIDPIECTVDEVFSVKITDEEVELLKDEKGEIRYEKVF